MISQTSHWSLLRLSQFSFEKLQPFKSFYSNWWTLYFQAEAGSDRNSLAFSLWPQKPDLDLNPLPCSFLLCSSRTSPFILLDVATFYSNSGIFPNLLLRPPSVMLPPSHKTTKWDGPFHFQKKKKKNLNITQMFPSHDILTWMPHFNISCLGRLVNN